MIAPSHRATLPPACSRLSIRTTAKSRPSAPRESWRPQMKTITRTSVVAQASTSNSEEEQQHHGPTCSSTRTLLVAVDESAASKRAVIFTLDHMYRPGDVVHLLHVVPRVRSTAAPSGALYYAPPLSCPEEARDALEQAARAFISREFASLIADRALPADALAVDVVHELPAGGGGSGGGGVGAGGESVGDAILRAAEELDAAALVMLSHEKKKLEQFIWGSVSKEVASRTRRPVVLVH